MKRLPSFSWGRLVLSAVVFALNVATSLDASAEPETAVKVGLSIERCAEPFEESLRRILRIELGELLDEEPSEAATTPETVRIRCQAEGALISARNAASQQVVHNDLRLGEFPGDAAPRAVALAVLEALRAVDPTLSTRLAALQAPAQSDGDRPGEAERGVPRGGAPHDAPARDAPKTADAARSVAPARAKKETRLESRARDRFMIGALSRSFLGTPRTTSFGARFEVSRRFASAWDAGVDLEATLARRRVSLGEAEARTLSLSAWFGGRAGGTQWSTTAALGARMGVAELRGAPVEDAARGYGVARAWGGPLLLLRGDGGMAPVIFAVALEGGLAVFGAEGLADDEGAIALSRGWLAASVSVGLRR